MRSIVKILLVVLPILGCVTAEYIPIIDIGKLHELPLDDSFCEAANEVVQSIHDACTTSGFFYIKNHNVPEELQDQLSLLARTFFNLPLSEKKSIDMNGGGKAWRGFFAVGEEVTSGIPDQKEGIYFGTELGVEDPRPLHGKNLWIEGPLGVQMKKAVLEYMSHMKQLGQLLMRTITCRFELDHEEKNTFLGQFENPTELFRIFNYPPHNTIYPANSFGVGEHTDYGYLTILKQDTSGGLQVKSLHNTSEWIDAPPVSNTFVINLGDALEHATDGIYRATPHRVLQRTHATEDRLSMPYFFDPSFDAEMQNFRILVDNEEDAKLRLSITENAARRWDGTDPRQFKGTYGNYLLRKVSRAFPELFAAVVDSAKKDSNTENVNTDEL